MAARKATGDDGRRQGIIQTLRGRGYRFIEEIEERSQDTAPRVSRVALAPPNAGEVSPGAAADTPEITPTPEPPAAPGTPVTGERKPVTALSCSLTNAASLMEALGPDDVHHLLQQFFHLAEDSIRRYGGTLTHFLDDGFRALFGAPVAHEDHASRAVLAAMDLQRRLQADPSAHGLDASRDHAVRMGLHTGLVLVGSIGQDLRLTSTAIAGTTELAVRCQEQAPPGAILVSEATSRLIRSVVRLEPWEPIVGTRPADRVAVYRVVDRERRRSSLGLRGDLALSQFVGRQRELDTLHALLDHVEEGRGQIVGIVGEPGMGKSRLLHEFNQSLDADRVHYFEGHCFSYGNTTPYLPILDMLRQVWGLAEGDGPDTITANVRAGFAQIGLPCDERMAALLHLLGVEEGSEALRHLSLEGVKSRTFESLRQLCFVGSRQLPLVLAIEDFHWIDATSEEFVASLVEYLAGTSLLLLATYRPGYQPAWLDRSYATQMSLMRLTSADSLRVVQSVLRSVKVQGLPTQEIVAKAAGNPFFLEELTQALAEPQAAAPAVPDTIQAVLAARIDRLPMAEKHLLQTAAVIGTAVPYSLLQAVAQVPEAELSRSLMALQTAELLYETRDVPQRSYTFKHVLTREVAYQSLLANTRQHLHYRIAQLLARELPELVTSQPELLAHHYTEAGLTPEAIDAWYRAGLHAMSRSAHVEATAHLRTGLQLLLTQPDTPERAQQELTLQMTLGSVLVEAKGYGAPEVEQAYTRAQALCDRVEDTAQRVTSLLGLWGVRFTRGELTAGRELAQQCLALAQGLPPSMPLIRSHS